MDTWGGRLQGSVVLGDLELKLVTGAERYDRTALTDFDFSPDTAIHSDLEDDASQVTQSLELSSELEEVSARWSVGGYYLMEDLDSDSLFTFNFNPRLFDLRVRQDYTQDTHSFGIYASGEWEFLEDFTLEGGARFNWERKDFEMQVARALGGAPDPNATGPADERQTWQDPSGGISLTYRASDEISTYVKYSRGWKSGHFNAAILENQLGAGGQGFVPDITFAKPETVDAVELGFSSAIWDSRLEARGAIFYYDYRDYQVFVLQNLAGAPPQFEILNAPESTVYGAELECFATPLLDDVPPFFEGLELVGRFGWLESEFDDFSRPRVVPVGGGFLVDTIDYSGNRLPNTPRFKASGSASYPLPLGRFGTVIPRYDFSYTDDVFFDPSDGRGTPPPSQSSQPRLPEYAVAQRAYWLHNVRLTYRVPGDAIEISGWVRNLTNERYKSFVADATPGFNSLLNFVGDPRTYGMSVALTF